MSFVKGNKVSTGRPNDSLNIAKAGGVREA